MVGSASKLRPASRPKVVKKKTNKFVRFEADLFKRMKVCTGLANRVKCSSSNRAEIGLLLGTRCAICRAG